MSERLRLAPNRIIGLELHNRQPALGSVFLNVFHIYAETEMSPWLHEVKASSLVLTGEMDGGCSNTYSRTSTT